MAASRLVRWLPLPAAAAGLVLAVITWAQIALSVHACPDDESEGSSAALGSPYADLVCTDVAGPLPRIWIAVAALTVVLVFVVIARVRRPLLLSLVLLVGPAALVAALQLTIPKDCTSGRTETGDCARDREQF